MFGIVAIAGVAVAFYLVVRYYGTAELPVLPPEVVEVYMPGVVNISDKVWQFCRAIAAAEGFGVAGATPTVFHNPGDLGPGDVGSQYPASYHGGSYVSQLPDDDTGWNLLYKKIYRALTGQSTTYSPNMTIVQFAQHYAGDWQNWSNNVARALGISPSTVIADWLRLP